MSRHHHENNLLLASARYPLASGPGTVAPGPAASGIDWNYVLESAGHHGLIPALFKTLSESVTPGLVPEPVMEKLRMGYISSLMNHKLLLSNLAPVLDGLADSQIPVMVMKGPALCQTVYDDAALRPFGDIDILIPRQHLMEGKNVMRDLGYSIIPDCYFPIPDEKNEELGGEWSYHKDGRIVELHWGLIDSLAPFHIDMSYFWQDARETEMEGRKVLIMNPSAQLMHLCLHQYRHRWKHIRDLTDIALLQERYVNEIDWQQFVTSAKEQGLERCVYYNLLVTSKVLGLPLPAQGAQSMLIGRRPNFFARTMVDVICGNILEQHLPRRFWDVLSVKGFSGKLASVKSALAHPRPRTGGRSQTAPAGALSLRRKITSAIGSVFYYRRLLMKFLRQLWQGRNKS